MSRREPGSVALRVLVALAGVLGAGATWSALIGDGERALDLAAGGAGVAVLAALLAAVRGAPALEADVEEGELRVRFSGWDVLWSLHREVRVPLTQVREVRVFRPVSLWSGWWHRRLGAVVPGTIKAGWFGGAGGRELWDVRAGADVIDVRLSPPSTTSRLVLQVPDPDGLARAIAAAAEVD